MGTWTPDPQRMPWPLKMALARGCPLSYVFSRSGHILQCHRSFPFQVDQGGTMLDLAGIANLADVSGERSRSVPEERFPGETRCGRLQIYRRMVSRFYRHLFTIAYLPSRRRSPRLLSRSGIP